VLTVSVLGTYLLITSHAATPYASINADKGAVTGAATKQACSGTSDGNCVQFGNKTTTNPALCGFATGSPQINKIMIIWEENHSLSDVQGTQYFDKMASSCGSAVNYFAYTHPSLPNYMTLTSGVSYASSPWDGDCIPTDSGCHTSNASIFSQLGSNWKSYAEDMPGNCSPNNSGNYAPKHNPAAYYTNIASACAKQDVPLGSTSSGNFITDIKNNTLPALTTVTPNLINDMHDGSVQDGSNWLALWVPLITASNDYQSGRLAIIVMGDEGSDGNSPSQTFAYVLSAYTRPGTQSSTSFNNYSELRTIEDITVQPALGQAASATSMVSAFNL
jgi:phosphatidylinositol-3-phosphatase